MWLCCLMSVGIQTRAQTPIIIGSSESWNDQNITGQTEYVEDQQGLTASEVSRLPDTVWESNAGAYTLHRRSSYPIWIRFRMLEAVSDDRKFYLQLGNRGINETALFVKRNGLLNSLGRTGDRFPFSRRPYPSTYFTFPLATGPDTLTYYLYCDKRHENLNLKLRLLSDQALSGIEDRAHIYMGLFGGIFLMAILISLVLLAIFRDPLNFWYAVYIICVVNTLLAFDGLDFKWIYPEHPFYADLSRFVASSLFLGMMIYVMQIFCNQQPDNSRFYRFANILRHLSFLLVPFTWLVYRQMPSPELKNSHFLFFIGVQLLGALVIIVSCIEKLLQRYRPAIFYLCAVMLLLYSGVWAILHEIGIADGSTDTPNMLQWSYVVEVILISTGILYKFQLVVRENRMLMTEMADLKLSSVKELLSLQQRDRTRISEDLHDLMGARLAVVKLKVAGLAVEDESKSEILRMIDELSVSSREIAHDLRSQALHGNDLAHIIDLHLTRLNEEQPISFQFVQSGEPRSLPPEMELSIYRILMELIANILRHSKATEALVQFSFQDDQFELLLEDNGIGISKDARRGIGTDSVRKRTAELKGAFHVDTRPGNTTYIITIPYTS